MVGLGEFMKKLNINNFVIGTDRLEKFFKKYHLYFEGLLKKVTYSLDDVRFEFVPYILRTKFGITRSPDVAVSFLVDGKPVISIDPEISLLVSDEELKNTIVHEIGHLSHYKRGITPDVTERVITEFVEKYHHRFPSKAIAYLFISGFVMGIEEIMAEKSINKIAGINTPVFSERARRDFKENIEKFKELREQPELLLPLPYYNREKLVADLLAKGHPEKAKVVLPVEHTNIRLKILISGYSNTLDFEMEDEEILEIMTPKFLKSFVRNIRPKIDFDSIEKTVESCKSDLINLYSDWMGYQIRLERLVFPETKLLPREVIKHRIIEEIKQIPFEKGKRVPIREIAEMLEAKGRKLKEKWKTEVLGE